MKGIEWLAKLILSALITSAVCIASTFWAVSTYADMILTQYNLKSAVSAAPGWSQFVAELGRQATGLSLFGGGKDAADKRTAAGTNSQADRPVSGAADSDSGAGVPDTGAPPTGGGSTTGKKPPEDAVAVFGHQSGQAAGSGSASTEDSKRIVMSGEDFAKKKDQLSNEEKNKIFNMLVSRVPQTEMQTISRLMEDGITAAELKQIEELLKTYLKPDEYNQLLGMIKAS